MRITRIPNEDWGKLFEGLGHGLLGLTLSHIGLYINKALTKLLRPKISGNPGNLIVALGYFIYYIYIMQLKK
jgi:hypothetical protein